VPSRLSVFLAAIALLSVSVAAPADARRGSGGATAGESQTPAESDSTPVTLTRTEVKDMQRALDVDADGEIGPQTRAALKRYERSQGMLVDGRPDAAVLEALGVEWGEDPSSPAPSGKAAAIVAAARSAIGSPYASGGTTPDGFDCSGLTTWAFRKAGIRLPRTSFEQYEVGREIASEDVAAGDLVFFDAAGAGASHVGIAVSNTRAISATSSGGVMEHPLHSGYWGEHYIGARWR
jgi:peptidoglycan DL-endopeptidase CwlO